MVKTTFACASIKAPFFAYKPHIYTRKSRVAQLSDISDVSWEGNGGLAGRNYATIRDQGNNVCTRLQYCSNRYTMAIKQRTSKDPAL